MAHNKNVGRKSPQRKFKDRKGGVFCKYIIYAVVIAALFGCEDTSNPGEAARQERLQIFAAAVSEAEDISARMPAEGMETGVETEVVMQNTADSSDMPVSPAVWIDIRNIDEGNPEFIPNEYLLSCTSQEVTLGMGHDTLGIMAAGSQSVIYPGAILDGISYLEGRYVLLTGGRRNPVNISTDLIGIDNSSIRVEDPGKISEVRQAIGRLIHANNGADVSPPVRLGLTHERIHTARQAATIFGLHSSVDAYNVVSASLDITDERENSSTSTRHMTRMNHVYYTVNVDPLDPTIAYSEPPQLSFGVEPVYISSVTYGRTALAVSTFTSRESTYERSIAAALNVNVSGIVDVGFEVSHTDSESARRDFENFQTLIHGGSAEVPTVTSIEQFAEYLQHPLSNIDAVPMAYTVNRLRDNTPVKTVLATTYNNSSCEFVPTGSARAVFVTPTVISGTVGDRVFGRISVDTIDNNAGNASGECVINTDNLIFNRVPSGSYTITADGNLERELGVGVSKPAHLISTRNKELIICADLTVGGRSVRGSRIVSLGRSSPYHIDTARSINPTSAVIENTETLELAQNFSIETIVQAQGSCLADDHDDCLPTGILNSTCSTNADCYTGLWCDTLGEEIDGDGVSMACEPQLPVNSICGIPHADAPDRDAGLLSHRCEGDLTCNNSWCSDGTAGSAGTAPSSGGVCDTNLFYDTRPTTGTSLADRAEPYSDLCEYGSVPVDGRCTVNRHCGAGLICVLETDSPLSAATRAGRDLDNNWIPILGTCMQPGS